MELKDRINAFVQLGDFLRTGALEQPPAGALGKKFDERFRETIKACFSHNGWFTEENVRLALASLADMLLKQKIEKWVSMYPALHHPSSIIRQPLSIGVIMAGNIPVVGFHDFICVLMSGNKFLGKLSSDDKLLMPLIADVLVTIEPRFKECISFTEGKLEGMHAVIATGSNNSARYFEHYFSKFPHVIRKNRSSVAVLNGTETEEELSGLGRDIFDHYGLGCRSVSKLFLPAGYEHSKFFNAVFRFGSVMENNKYANNYEYNRTIYLMNGEKFLDNNFLILREDISLHSPVGVLLYEYYSSEERLRERLRMDAANIQCIVSKMDLPGAIPFGTTQCPMLWDYADGVDTMKFLLTLKS